MKLLAVALATVVGAVGAFGQPTFKPLDAGSDVPGQILSIADGFAVRQIDWWFSNGQFPRLINYYRFRAELYPTNYDVATDLGWMLESVEENDSAEAVYLAYRDRAILDPDRFLPLGQFYFLRKKDYAKTVATLEPAIKVKCHPNNYRLLGQVYTKLEKLEDALRVYRQFLKEYPDDETAKANVAKAEERLKKKV
ncbi:MAG: hypothetical protein JST40_10145 [Armatimonadetes bacterium]|nr:hypothetical protein [Armatimonadota bacterium]